MLIMFSMTIQRKIIVNCMINSRKGYSPFIFWFFNIVISKASGMDMIKYCSYVITRKYKQRLKLLDKSHSILPSKHNKRSNLFLTA